MSVRDDIKHYWEMKAYGFHDLVDLVIPTNEQLTHAKGVYRQLDNSRRMMYRLSQRLNKQGWFDEDRIR